MKLVLAVLHNEQVYDLMEVLSEHGYIVTKVASTGGFLRASNTTLMCGTEEEKVPKLLELIEKNCKSRRQIRPSADIHMSVGGGILPLTSEISVGGATCFVVDVDKYVKF